MLSFLTNPDTICEKLSYTVVPGPQYFALSQSVSDTSPKSIDRAGLAEGCTGTKQVRNGVLIFQILMAAMRKTNVTCFSPENLWCCKRPANEVGKQGLQRWRGVRWLLKGRNHHW